MMIKAQLQIQKSAQEAQRRGLCLVTLEGKFLARLFGQRLKAKQHNKRIVMDDEWPGLRQSMGCDLMGVPTVNPIYD